MFKCEQNTSCPFFQNLPNACQQYLFLSHRFTKTYVHTQCCSYKLLLIHIKAWSFTLQASAAVLRHYFPQRFQSFQIKENVYHCILDKYEVTCPRCRRVSQRVLKSVPQIANVEGLFSRGLCKHCQAQIKDQLKKEGKVLRRKKEEGLLKDAKITKLKDESLSTLWRETQKLIPPKKEPRITPLISSLTLDDERLSGDEAVKKVSIKGTVEVIQEPRYDGILGENSESKMLLPPGYDDMYLDDESGIYLKMNKDRDKRLFEKETKTLRRPRKSTTNLKQFRNIKPHHENEYNDLSINSLLSKLSEAPKSFLKNDFQFNFPKRAKKKLGESKKIDRILSASNSLTRLQMQAEEKKKKSEKEKKNQEVLNERQKKGVLDSSITSPKGEGDKKKIPRTLESEPSKADESLHKGKKRQKDSEFYESKEDFGQGKKGQKSKEGKYNKKLEKGPQDFEPDKEGKNQQFKKDKALPDNEKGLLVTGKDKKKFDKEKELPDNEKGLSVSGKGKNISDKDKTLLVPEKDKKKIDKDKTLPDNGKGLSLPEKDKKIPDKDKALSAAGKDKNTSDTGKAVSARGKDKNTDNLLSASGTQLQSGKGKQISDKTLLTAGKELSHKQKEEKSVDEKAWHLPPGKDNEKSDKATIPALGKRLPAPTREKALDAAEGAAMAGVKKKGKDVTYASKSKDSDENKEPGKQKAAQQGQKDLVDKNNIKVKASTDNMLSNLITKQRENRQSMPTTVTTPLVPAVSATKPRRMKKEKRETSESLESELEGDFIESEEGSLPVDEVVYENKIIKKHKMHLARRSPETKERAAEIAYTNIFKDDLFQRTKEVPVITEEVQSKPKAVSPKVSLILV